MNITLNVPNQPVQLYPVHLKVGVPYIGTKDEALYYPVTEDWILKMSNGQEMKILYRKDLGGTFVEAPNGTSIVFG